MAIPEFISILRDIRNIKYPQINTWYTEIGAWYNSLFPHIGNIDAVGSNIANVNAVAINETNINTVAQDLLEPESEINTVAENILAVEEVADWITTGIPTIGSSESVSFVGTISALRLLNYSGQKVVSVTGYYTALDNIGIRNYYWDATSTEIDNGGTTIQVTGVIAGRWKMKVNGAIDVKWFGAKGDAITDDTIAIQSAINNSNYVEITNVHYVTDELFLTSDITIEGNGTIVMQQTTGDVGLAPSVLVGFDLNNIVISGITISGAKDGRSGVWTPVGSLVDVGSCILLAGCDNVLISGTTTSYGGNPANGNGVGNIYISSCRNVNISNNTSSLADNGIVCDQWYTRADGKSLLYNQGINIVGNNIFNLSGRGIAVERLDNDNGGETNIKNNNIYNILYSGVQIRNGRNINIVGNNINLANIGRTVEITDGRNGLYGIEGQSTNRNIVISNNNITNPRTNAMLCYNVYGTIIANNNIIYDNTIGDSGTNNQPALAILCQNTDANEMRDLNISNNTINGFTSGIRCSKASGFTGAVGSYQVSNNIIKFNAEAGGTGIYADFDGKLIVSNNELVPILTYNSSLGIDIRILSYPNIADNSISSLSTAVAFTGTLYPRTSNIINGCAVANYLESTRSGYFSDYINSCTTAFQQAGSLLGVGDAKNTKYNSVTTYKTYGNATLRIQIDATAYPTVGNWGVGDKVYNSSPTAGGFDGWVCVSNGTPGTWKTFGAITA